MRALLDTSVLIADEQGRELHADRLPDECAISVVTLAELELGVHLAATDRVRSQRLATLRATQAGYVAVPIEESVAAAFAEVVASARRDGRRPRVQDAWIAATAMAHGAAVCTQDGDYGAFPSLTVIRV